MEARITVQSRDGAHEKALSIRFVVGGVESEMECAFGRILEARIPLTAVGITEGAGLRFQFSLWREGLPMDAIPQQGWLEVP